MNIRIRSFIVGSTHQVVAELARYWLYGAGACLKSLYPFWSHDLVAMDSLLPGCGFWQGHAGKGPGLLWNPATSLPSWAWW